MSLVRHFPDRLWPQLEDATTGRGVLEVNECKAKQPVKHRSVIGFIVRLVDPILMAVKRGLSVVQIICEEPLCVI